MMKYSEHNSRLTKQPCKRWLMMLLFVLFPIAAMAQNDVQSLNIHVTLPDGVPAGSQGNIEVDIRSWRAEETTTLTTQIPVVDDPAPQVTFDPDLPDQLNLQVGEALQLPVTIEDAGRNDIVVEYLLDGELLVSSGFSGGGSGEIEVIPAVLEEFNVGSLVYAGSDGPEGQLYNADYYSFTLPENWIVDFRVSDLGGVLSDQFVVLYLFIDDGELTADDFIRVVENSGIDAFPAGNYIAAVVIDPPGGVGGSNVDEVADGQPHPCFECNSVDVDYEFLISRSPE